MLHEFNRFRAILKRVLHNLLKLGVNSIRQYISTCNIHSSSFINAVMAYTNAFVVDLRTDS